jgi:hypothetical protein
MEKIIDKSFRKLNISSNSLVAHMNQYASNSSATHNPLESTQFNMSLNYFPSQTLSARDTFLDKEVLKSEMVFSLPMVFHASSVVAVVAILTKISLETEVKVHLRP